MEIHTWWNRPAKKKFNELAHFQLYREKQAGINNYSKLCFELMLETLEYFDGLCPYCGEGVVNDGYAYCYLDHMVPVAMGGKFEYGNIVGVCWRCSMYKGAADLDEWLQEKCTPERATKIRRFKSGK